MEVKKLSAGAYIYKGYNFSVEFDNDEGYWAINDCTITNDVEIDFMQYERKKDLVWDLKSLDAKIGLPK
jgi:hypothetical protein